MVDYAYVKIWETVCIGSLNFSRMVFNVLATNCDDHTKNFSFRLQKGKKWELAPAYDICFSYDPTNAWVNQQTLSVNGKNINISKEDLLAIGRANNIKKCEKIIFEINTIVKAWYEFAAKANVGKDLQQEIQKNLHTI